MALGRFFTPAEDRSHERVAVIGADIPEEMEVEPEALVGQQISIRGIPFPVIGMLEGKGNSPGGGNVDENIYIPFRTGEYRISGPISPATFGSGTARPSSRPRPPPVKR